MTLEERLKCIKHINLEAHCVVWEGGIVKYDPAHIGVKPTLKECEAVLSIVQEQMASEETKQLDEEKIQAKMRELAIQSLKASGELSKDYK